MDTRPAASAAASGSYTTYPSVGSAVVKNVKSSKKLAALYVADREHSVDEEKIERMEMPSGRRDFNLNKSWLFEGYLKEVYTRRSFRLRW